MNDMTPTIAPKSDQWNADDMLAGPVTVTIRDVKIAPGTEQPVNIMVEGSDKAFRPCKSSCRVLVAAWGADAKAYIGRSLTLYRDADVKWGGLAVGGIRISHMSNLDGPQTMMLTATKGSRKPHKVLPLVDAPKAETKDDPAAKWAAAYIAKLATLETAAAIDEFAAPKADKLASLLDKRPELHGEVTAAVDARKVELFAAPELTDDPEFTATLAEIAAAPDIAAIDALDQKTDAHRAFLTDAQCDALNEALAGRRAELRVAV